jgi:hypothetical protein
MNAKLRRRLDLLEKNTQFNRASMQEEIMAAALSAMSREDLEHLHQFTERGEPSVATLDEKAALDRYQVAYEAASLRIAGQVLS